ncbi:hypothetical protein ANANG_G00137010 [Anguilla anguilla]|uniref:Uncharacterized protein n=1 Tax=Anguilla anguilla TaxID=7936 RepID=A0A9D3MBT9_ANGAN|nr:hypothetical protein ANANG_G00137010 [Anguilla anguilla]
MSRLLSHQDCRSPPPLPWVASPPPEVPVQELANEGCPESQQHPPEAEAEETGGSEEDNNNIDSDSSSCRTSNSTQTISSCHTMEPCGPEELFQALSHAEHTFHKMESYLRHKQLCDVSCIKLCSLPFCNCYRLDGDKTA